MSRTKRPLSGRAQMHQILLRSLQEEENFGQKRIKQLSDFLLVYIQKQLNSENPDIRDFAQAQKWTALVYTAPFQATQELALALGKAYKEDKGDIIRITSVVETLAQPQVYFQQLLLYARGMKEFVRVNLKESHRV